MYFDAWNQLFIALLFITLILFVIFVIHILYKYGFVQSGRSAIVRWSVRYTARLDEEGQELRLLEAFENHRSRGESTPLQCDAGTSSGYTII